MLKSLKLIIIIVLTILILDEVIIFLAMLEFQNGDVQVGY